MASLAKPTGVWADIKEYRRAYTLTAVASFGGMLFGWDTVGLLPSCIDDHGLIGGVLTMDSFKNSFALTNSPAAYADLSGNIVSVLQAGCFVGAAASFWVSDTFGRKSALIYADIIFIIGSLLQTCSAIGNQSLALLYVGRVIGGVGVGLISAVVPTYIGENVNKEIRGRCIGTMQLFNVTGIMLSYFVNYGVTRSISSSNDAQWRIPFALQMLPGVLLFVGILFQNESPRWLVEKDRHDDAARALAHVRSYSHDDPVVTKELGEIVADFQSHEKISLLGQLRTVCSDRKYLYRYSMAIILMMFQQWTGTNSINYYSPQIFESIGLGSSAGLFATGIYGVVKVVITALALAFMTEQLGRKWSLIIGALGQAFAMFYIGINQAVNPVVEGAALDRNSIFAIISVYLFVVFYSVGWGPIPFILASETSPNRVRSLTMASALMCQWAFNCVIARITPVMLNSITYGTFLIFGICCILMTIYTIFCVPETKGVPLESISLLFEGNIIKGATYDTIPKHSRAKKLQNATNVTDEDEGNKGDFPIHVERAKDV
ncbi:general substrate transporter [Aureobasidium subglaciale]|nr:general substrate transporter [Aureobasidium subglaciale]KAI5232356.1 general substrate transporter [Aureobasidium subglaciale]KAI5234640.1 general substrate transporter [Aureobasidium subglaciale]KAI5268447.1 general substrate transporter [Aureobasidium subglaciale]